MTKSKKERKRNESEEEDDSSSSSSDSASSTSSSSDQSVVKKKSKKKKASAKKSKRQRKASPSSSSSSSSESDGDSSPERKKPAAKRPSNDLRESRPSRNDDKYQGHDQSNRRNKRDYDQNTSNRSKWDSPNVEYSGGHRDHRNRQNPDDRPQRRDNNFRRNWNQNNRGRDEHNRNWDRDRGDNKRNSDHDRQPDRRHDNRRDFHENRNDGHRDQDSRNNSNNNNNNQGRRNFQERRDDRDRRRSRSPRRPRNFPRRRDDDNNENYEWGKRETSSGKEEEPPAEKEKPNFGLSGKLTEDTNKVNGIVIKYAEPLEARKPKRRWRLYPFKGEKALSTLYIHRQSCYLIGRDRKVCDLPVDHPSCSKQHAALQYRLVPFTREDGTAGKRVRPYIIDLESANGTFLNNKPIESKKYFELIEKDVVKFGFSSREYVLLHENSKEDELDDDVIGDESDGGGAGPVEVKEEPTG